MATAPQPGPQYQSLGAPAERVMLATASDPCPAALHAAERPRRAPAPGQRSRPPQLIAVGSRGLQLGPAALQARASTGEAGRHDWVGLRRATGVLPRRRNHYQCTCGGPALAPPAGLARHRRRPSPVARRLRPARPAGATMHLYCVCRARGDRGRWPCKGERADGGGEEKGYRTVLLLLVASASLRELAGSKLETLV